MQEGKSKCKSARVLVDECKSARVHERESVNVRVSARVQSVLV